jgi:hypothetical protein
MVYNQHNKPDEYVSVGITSPSERCVVPKLLAEPILFSTTDHGQAFRLVAANSMGGIVEVLSTNPSRWLESTQRMTLRPVHDAYASIQCHVQCCKSRRLDQGTMLYWDITWSIITVQNHGEGLGRFLQQVMGLHSISDERLTRPLGPGERLAFEVERRLLRNQCAGDGCLLLELN